MLSFEQWTLGGLPFGKPPHTRTQVHRRKLTAGNIEHRHNQHEQLQRVKKRQKQIPACYGPAPPHVATLRSTLLLLCSPVLLAAPVGKFVSSLLPLTPPAIFPNPGWQLPILGSGYIPYVYILNIDHPASMRSTSALALTSSINTCKTCHPFITPSQNWIKMLCSRVFTTKFQIRNLAHKPEDKCDVLKFAWTQLTKCTLPRSVSSSSWL